jgi:hypothetical protein
MRNKYFRINALDRKKLIILALLLITAVVGLSYWNNTAKKADQQAEANIDEYAKSGKVKSVAFGQITLEIAVPKVNQLGMAEASLEEKIVYAVPETIILNSSDGKTARLSDIKPGADIIVYSTQDILEHKDIKASRIEIQ